MGTQSCSAGTAVLRRANAACVLPAGGPITEIAELHQGEKLLHTVERWLRTERETRPKEEAPPAPRSAPAFANRHMAFFR